MKLTNTNYFSPDANKSYWSVSQFKEFDSCEARGLASARGLYHREETDALLIGSYVDAYFAGTMDEFIGEHEERMFKKNGELYAKFDQANKCINAVECQPLMMEYLEGDKQTIMTGKLFGVDWKIKMDVFNGDRIVDLKCMRDFESVYKEGFGRISFVEAWGYDIQGAIYQKVEQMVTGRSEPLPFYIAAVTKEKTPDIDLIHIPQHILDAAYHLVEAKIDRFDLIKSGDIEPNRCERCDYCKQTKILTGPREYEIKEAE